MKAGREAEYQVDIPPRLVPGSLRLDARLVTGAADQFEQSLAAMVGRPSGCFEQTSSTLHPRGVSTSRTVWRISSSSSATSRGPK